MPENKFAVDAGSGTGDASIKTRSNVSGESNLLFYMNLAGHSGCLVAVEMPWNQNPIKSRRNCAPGPKPHTPPARHQHEGLLEHQPAAAA